MLDGADHVVVGRPIRNADDPIKIIRMLQDEIEQGLAGRKTL
jgi:orotidine-5'-phosphate decarboxylase